jgi:hypothetical protein
MATKKKTKKKSKKSAGRKVMPAKQQSKKAGTPKKLARRTSARKKIAAKKKGSKKATSGKTARAGVKEPRKRRLGRRASEFSRERPEPRSGPQSGDLQGLSDVESADSESVDELVEEGNAFEAGVVTGVEEADEHDAREVHTHEVPEDDVPGEYLDED